MRKRITVFWGRKKTRRVERVARRGIVVLRELLEDDDGETSLVFAKRLQLIKLLEARSHQGGIDIGTYCSSNLRNIQVLPPPLYLPTGGPVF